MEENKKKKKLSNEAIELISEKTKEISKESIEKELAYIRENFIKIVAEQTSKIKDIQRDNFIEDQIYMTDYILKKYLPIKKEIKSIEKYLLTTDFLAETEDEIVRKLMTSPYKETTTISEDILKNYLSLKQIYAFLDSAINNYISDLKKEIDELEDSAKNNKVKERIKNLISKNERKIYIVEHYYKEGESAKSILSRYNNERRYYYDKLEIQKEIAPSFTLIYSILYVF